MDDVINWGPVIEVDSWPTWLDGDQIVDVRWSHSWYSKDGVEARHVGYKESVTAIRLPADHPYYSTPLNGWKGDTIDTVTVKRMTEEEITRAFGGCDEAPAGQESFKAWHAAFAHLGLIQSTPLSRFLAANPGCDRDTAEKALAWRDGE